MVSEDTSDDMLPFVKAHRRQVRSDNPHECLNEEVHRRSDVAGILPNRFAVIHLGDASRANCMMNGSLPITTWTLQPSGEHAFVHL